MRFIACLLLLLIPAKLTTAQEEPPLPEPAPEPAKAELTRMKLGEFWYGMYLPDGSTEGYARMSLRETKQGGVHCDWELHITYDGGSYEEERKITFDADWRMTYSEFEASGQRVLGAREGDVVVGKSGVDDLRVEISDDAVTGMGFVLAGAAPFKSGAKFTRHEYNEAQNFKDLATTTFVVGDHDDVELPEGKVQARRIDMQRSEKGRALPIWVNEAREIVQIDWGTNNFMKLHREKTESLFNPKPPLLTELEPADKTKLVLTGDFNGFTLEQMWKHWATGEGITKWWPPEANIEGKVGGRYELIWKGEDGEISWQLLGKVEIWEPNKKLGFTWTWNSDPKDAPTLHVVVEFSEIKDGVQVKITHSAFDANNDDQQNRASLKQGWEFFCTKLAALKK
ncbi:MAG: SRPBCC domain-containing protein [Planctomycetes bacterium]|nr:SRPBCC domain-containing protein [Planctomycetota bacterium]